MSAARAWSEYLAWTRGAHDGQYEITEERAWHRLQVATLRDTVVPVELELPDDQDQDQDQDQEPESLSPLS